MLENEITINKFLVGYCHMLVDDLDDVRLADQPVPGINHPAWILGHLTFVAHRAEVLITGGEVDLPESFVKQFGPGSKLTANRTDYPSKIDLVRMLDESHERLQRTVAAATPEQLSKPSQHPRTKDKLPTINELVAFLMTGHFAVHLGQLTVWRRTIGLPALF